MELCDISGDLLGTIKKEQIGKPRLIGDKRESNQKLLQRYCGCEEDSFRLEITMVSSPHRCKLRFCIMAVTFWSRNTVALLECSSHCNSQQHVLTDRLAIFVG